MNLTYGTGSSLAVLHAAVDRIMSELPLWQALKAYQTQLQYIND
jgi:hypothetical protein